MSYRASSYLLAAVFSSCGGGTPAPSPGPAAAVASAPSLAEPRLDAAGPDSAAVAAPAKATPPPIEPDAPRTDDPRYDELARAAADVQDAFFDSDPALTADDGTLVFASNRDGHTQLYTADAKSPSSPVKRLVTRDDRTGAYSVMPDGKTVVFTSDRGADENWSIFRVGIDGAADPTELTPGEALHRDFPIALRGVPDTIAYSGRSNEEKNGHVYVQSLLPGSEPKLVYTDSGPSYLVDVSRDGQVGLMVRVQSMSDSTLLLVDFAAGTSKPIWPARSAPENVGDAGFSADDSLIYLTTDAGGEEADVVALGRQDLKEKARYVEKKPATALIEQITIARKSSDRVGILVDAGNHAEVRLLDGKTLKSGPKVTLPLGSGSNLRMSDDGRSLLLSFSTPDHPRDVYAVDTHSGASRALRQEPRPTVAKLPRIAASIRTIKSFDGTLVPVNLYLPDPQPKKKLPTLVVVHGGPASSYAIRWSVINRFFSAQGWAVVEPNVRGSTGFGRQYERADDYRKRMDAVRDVEDVGRWASGQPWCDPDKLVILGGSYGGYMTLMGVTHHPKLWKAGVDLFGIYSWRSFMATTSGVIREVFQKEIGPESDKGFLDAVSPAAKIDQVVAPLFVYAGANDPRVPRSESDAIVKSLRERKIPVEYMVAGNEGHSLDHKENVVAFLARAQRFLETSLGIEPPKAKGERARSSDKM